MSAQLNNSQLWELSYQEYKEATQATPNGGYYPLPAFEIPITFSSKILIAKTVSNIPVGKRWKWAGKLRALQTFPNAGINSQKTEVVSHSLYLNRSKLLVYSEFAGNFELVLSDAFWLRDLQLTIYSFTGKVDDAIKDSILSIQSDLYRIEDKINNLSS